MSWYGCWISEQVLLTRPCIFAIMNGYTPHDEAHLQPPLLDMWARIADCLREGANTSVDGIVNLLAAREILDLEGHDRNSFQARQLVFAVVGWQTMLWKVELSVSPPGRLAVADEMCGF